MATWVTPSTITSGQTAGVSTALATYATDLTVIGQAWQTWVPTTTGITVGNGTLSCRYNQTGKTVDFTVTFTFGSTSVITASPTFTLPATALSATQRFCGSQLDSSVPNTWDAIGVGTSTTQFICRQAATVAGGNFAAISSTSPFTWATGDVLFIQGRYEAA